MVLTGSQTSQSNQTEPENIEQSSHKEYDTSIPE